MFVNYLLTKRWQFSNGLFFLNLFVDAIIAILPCIILDKYSWNIYFSGLGFIFFIYWISPFIPFGFRFITLYILHPITLLYQFITGQDLDDEENFEVNFIINRLDVIAIVFVSYYLNKLSKDADAFYTELAMVSELALKDFKETSPA